MFTGDKMKKTGKMHPEALISHSYTHFLIIGTAFGMGKPKFPRGLSIDRLWVAIIIYKAGIAVI
jgi:hypothetical protein